jgi:prefoldin beta subunit
LSDDISQLPPQVQEQLLRLQQLQQTLQMVISQKQQLELESSEIERALSELQKVTDDATVYKSIGSLLIKTQRAEIMKELEERKDLAKTRITVLAKQEERTKERVKELQQRLQERLRSPATEVETS